MNNLVTGGSIYEPSAFSFTGGSIESNGFTKVTADTRSWGIKVISGGTEGSVGINMQGTYLENNNGMADVWIVQTENTVIHNLNGVSFLRASADRYVTCNVLFDCSNASRVAVSGCGFKSYKPYVSSADRPFLGGTTSKILDGGGNLFADSDGGTVGLRPSVFAPLGVNHSQSFASLPNAAEHINGLQYCADGSGTAKPSLAVSDGAKWHQLALGQYAGFVRGDGGEARLPRGWSVRREAAGVYAITHNLHAPIDAHAFTATASGGPNTGRSGVVCCGYSQAPDSVQVYFAKFSGQPADTDFSFTFSAI